MENSMQDPQKIKNRTLYDPAIPFLGTYPKKMKSFKKISAPSHSVQHCLQKPRHGDNPDIHRWMNQ